MVPSIWPDLLIPTWLIINVVDFIFNFQTLIFICGTLTFVLRVENFGNSESYLDSSNTPHTYLTSITRIFVLILIY